MAMVKAVFSFLWTLLSGIAKGVWDAVRPKQDLPPPAPVRPAVPQPQAAPAKPQAPAPQPQTLNPPPVKAAPAPAPADPFNILSDEKPKPAAPAAKAEKAGRTILQPTVLVEKEGSAPSEEIRIKAQPSKAGDSCKFMVDRPVFAGHSWFFGSKVAAQGSALAEKLFALDDVESVVVLDSTVTVTRKNKNNRDWKPLAKEIGALLREHLRGGAPAVAEKILSGMPSEEEIRRTLQRTIEMEVNPGVAAHGGVITLTSVVGNTVTISMGGGCQGCSAADITLKEGIHNSFRRAQPFVGAILDETNHAAGENPYFS